LGRYATVVVANSAGGAHYWKNIRCGPSDIHQVANAVDVDKVREVCETNAHLNYQCGPSVVLVVGRMVESKGYSTVVQAVRLVAEKHMLRALFVGGGPFKPEIERQIKEAGQERSISLLPYDSNWWSRMNGTTCLVSMSKLEGQPNVVLEAMAASCPLVISDIPAHREILDETCAVFVAVGDSVGLSKAIIGIMVDPDSARRRAALALDRVRLLTVGVMADAYTALYCQSQGRKIR
jgi:glycosyltransferase involved in cell wall biosynthesis